MGTENKPKILADKLLSAYARHRDKGKGTVGILKVFTDIIAEAEKAISRGRVVIYLEGGLVHNVEKQPEDIEVVVQDYDIESCDECELSLDENGRECFKVVY